MSRNDQAYERSCPRCTAGMQTERSHGIPRNNFFGGWVWVCVRRECGRRFVRLAVTPEPRWREVGIA